MGRYARFNTEFEYKFGFAMQDSSDIQLWEGEYEEFEVEWDLPCCDEKENGIACECEPHFDCTQSWSDEDRPKILAKLTVLLKTVGIKINWDDFPNTLEGTEMLYDWWFKTQNQKLKENPDYWSYMLGSLIVHQLGYEESLYADFDEM